MPRLLAAPSSANATAYNKPGTDSTDPTSGAEPFPTLFEAYISPITEYIRTAAISGRGQGIPQRVYRHQGIDFPKLETH